MKPRDPGTERAACGLWVGAALQLMAGDHSVNEGDYSYDSC